MIEYIQSPQFQQLLEQHPDYIFIFLVIVAFTIVSVSFALSNWFSFHQHHYHYHPQPQPERQHPAEHIPQRASPPDWIADFDEWMQPPSQSSRKTRRKIKRSKRFRILKRDGFRCQLCGRKANEDDGIELHIDHKMPISKGGTDDDDNLWTLCNDCNLGKSDEVVDEIIDGSDDEKEGGK